MSSTNRGVERELDDVYRTPEWLTKEILPTVVCPLSERHAYDILDPGCGNGRIGTLALEYARTITKRATLDLTDITDQGCGARIGNFLEMDFARKYDLIIGNPPYVLAQEFVDTARPLLRGKYSKLVLMLRINFLGSQKRAAWHRKWMPSIYVTPKRPRFNEGKRTDSCEYAWIVWDNNRPTVHILETEYYKEG